MLYNQLNHFNDKSHEALMSVWWGGILLRQYARSFFSRTELPSEAQFNVLLLLKYAEKPLTQVELSERLLVDKSNLTGLIDRLERANLIHRVVNPGDRRRKMVELSADGKTLFEKIEKLYRNQIHQLMSVFKPEELATLTNLMCKLHQALGEADK